MVGAWVSTTITCVAAVPVLPGNDVVGSVSVVAVVRWNYTIPAPGLTEGPHNLSVTATDPVGNESGKSDPFTVN
ncbi:Ig-like domain-containing protein, partial [Acinetobacter soli]